MLGACSAGFLRVVACLVGWMMLASCPVDATAQGFSLKKFREFRCNEKTTFAIAVDSSQRLLATGGADNQVTLWDLSTSKQLRQWQPSKSSVIDLQFVPMTHLVVSVSYPKHLTLYDTRADRQVWQTELLSPATRVSVSRDGKKVLVGFFFGKAAVYDAKTGKLLVTINEPANNSNGVEFSADGRLAFYAANTAKGKEDGPAEILVCDVATGKRKGVLAQHQSQIQRLRLSPDGARLLAVDKSGVCRVYDLRTTKSIGQWRPELTSTWNASFVDGDTAIVGGDGGYAVVKVGTQKPSVHSTDNGVNRIAPLAGRGVVAMARGNSVTLYRFDQKSIDMKTAVVKVASGIEDARGADANAKSELLATANEPPEGIRFDGLASRDELASLVGKPMVAKLRSGLMVTDVAISRLDFDRNQHGLQFLKHVNPRDRSGTIKAADLYAFWANGTRYHLRYFPPTRQLFVINSQVADSVAEGRLSAEGKRVRERRTEKQQSESTTEHKKFLEDAIKKLKDVAVFHIEETDSTLIFTDYPSQMTVGIKQFVDRMNGQLGMLFGIPSGTSIWPGKPVVAVFSNTARFAAFEQIVMGNPNHGGNAGVRSSGRRFLQTAIVKKLDDRVARGLAWGYSLGYAQQLHSNAQNAPWMNMGIASVAQYRVVPNPRAVSGRRSNVTKRMKETGTLLGILDASKLDQSLWPICGEIVQFLAAADPIAFAQMFRDVKLGVPIDDALKQNFAMDKEDLALRFGQSIGVRNLQQ